MPRLKMYARNAVYLSLIGLLLPWLMWRSLRTGRYRHGLIEKFIGCRPLRRLPSSSIRIWLHGVSVGEVQLLAPLIEQLRNKMSHAEFIVSTTTDTGMDLAVKLYGDKADVQLIYFPLDFSWAVQRTIESVDADLLVLGELEVWPNLMAAATRSQLPVVVVNGRLSPNSYRGYKRLSWLARPMFNSLRLVIAQTEEYAQRFIDCGVPANRVVVGGSFKFDNISFDSSCREVQQLAELVGITAQQTVWVVGSSQDPEEIVCCQAFIRARQHYPQLKLIVVPRHRERFAEVFEQLRAQPIRVLRRSELNQPIEADQWDVLLVDTIGELRWWWGLSSLALVGGSFGSRNGQNMLEPAGYGSNVAFGPKTLNFRAIVEMLLSARAAQQIESLEAIEEWLIGQLENPTAGREQGVRAQQMIRRHQGTIARTVEYLIQTLPQTKTVRQTAA